MFLTQRASHINASEERGADIVSKQLDVLELWAPATKDFLHLLDHTRPSLTSVRLCLYGTTIYLGPLTLLGEIRAPFRLNSGICQTWFTECFLALQRFLGWVMSSDSLSEHKSRVTVQPFSPPEAVSTEFRASTEHQGSNDFYGILYVTKVLLFYPFLKYPVQWHQLYLVALNITIVHLHNIFISSSPNSNSVPVKQ